MFLLLFRDQKLFGDLNLLFLRIAGDCDHFHPVKQRARNIVQGVGCNHPKHMGQVKRKLDIVVAERIVLLRIQHFQQCGAGITPEIRAHLIDLIQQKHGIFRTHRFHTLNDPTRQRSHIGTPMAPYLGLIAHTAKRNPDKFAFH